VIELTAEMRDAYTAGTGEPNWFLPRRHNEGLAAVLAIVERDYPLIRPCPSGPAGRCLAIRHSPANAGICASLGCVYPGDAS